MRRLIPLAAALLLLLPAAASAQTAAQLCASGLRQYCPPPPRPTPVIHHTAPPAPTRVSPPVQARSSERRPGEAFRDAPDAPEMVVVPPGAFTMGSPASEPNHESDETQHGVTIGHALAVGRYAVTRDEYAAFVAETGHKPADDNGCYALSNGSFALNAQASWRSPGFDQSGSDPVVCVSWEDANAYASWLSRKTGHAYRLLSESEWEYAARAGTTSAYWWGDDIGVNRANCAGCGSQWDNKRTSPVGSFAPNAFGLYDMAGDVWQWTEDCYASDYSAAPTDGSASTGGDCGRRVLRGGSWFSGPGGLRSAGRGSDSPGYRSGSHGFRVARTL